MILFFLLLDSYIFRLINFENRIVYKNKNNFTCGSLLLGFDYRRYNGFKLLDAGADSFFPEFIKEVAHASSSLEPLVNSVETNLLIIFINWLKL